MPTGSSKKPGSLALRRSRSSDLAGPEEPSASRPPRTEAALTDEGALVALITELKGDAPIPMSSWWTVCEHVTKTLQPRFETDDRVRVTAPDGEWKRGEGSFDRILCGAFSIMRENLLQKHIANAAMTDDEASVIADIARLLVANSVRVAASTVNVFTLASSCAQKGTDIKRLASTVFGLKNRVYVRTDPDTHGRTSIQNTESRTVRVEFHEWPRLDGGVPGRDRVGVVVGPSGAAKTSYLLSALPDGVTSLVTFFVMAHHIKERVEKVLRRTSGEAWAVFEPYLVRAEVVSDGVTPASSLIALRDVCTAFELEVVENEQDAETFAKAVRNATVRKVVAKLVAESVEQMRQTTAAKLLAPGADSGVGVRVAIDEAGETKGIVRAVIAAQDKLREGVRAACRIDDTEFPVDVMVGGTGCGAPDDPHGSAVYVNKYTVVDMDAQFSAWFAAEVFCLPKNFKNVVGNTDNPATSHGAVATVEELLRNARLGALIRLALQRMDTRRRRSALVGHPETSADRTNQSLDALESHLRGVVLDAMDTFFQMNGLKALGVPEIQRVLADAMSVDVNGFDAIADAELRERLVTKYGVLHDRAQVQAKEDPPSGFRVINRALHVARGGATKDVLVVPADRFGRYVMPAAMRALFVTLCVGELPRIHGGSDADGVERLAWRWGAALQLCVAAGSSVSALLRHVCWGREPLLGTAAAAAANALLPPGRDAAFKGRALLEDAAAPIPAQDEHDRFSHAARSVVGRADVKAKRGAVKAAIAPGAHLVQSRSRFPNTSLNATTAAFDCCAAVLARLKAACAVAVLNAPQAPYADVALYSWLFGGGGESQRKRRRFECVLIQAKLYLATALAQENRGASAGQDGLVGEFTKMAEGMGATEKGLAKGDTAVVTRVFLVAAPRGNVVRKRVPLSVPTVKADGLAAAQQNVVVHIETDGAGIVAEKPRLLPALYPLTVRRLTTWVPADAAPE